MMRIKHLTLAVLGLFTLAGCDARNDGDSNLTTIPFLIDWDPEPTYIGIYYAKAQGLFEQAGYDVNIVPLRGANAVVQAVAAGNNPIGTASGGATVIGASAGNKTVSLAVLYPNISTVVYGPADRNVQQPKDLEGKRVAIYPTSITKNEFEAFMRRTGIDRSKVRIVDAVGSDLEFLEQNQADAVLNYADMSPARLEISPTAPRINGKTSFELPLAQFGVAGYGLNIIASPGAYSRNGDRMRALAGAAVQGYVQGCANQSAAVEAFLKAVHKTPDRMNAERSYAANGWRRVCAMLGPNPGSQDADGWQRTITAYGDLGLLHGPLRPSDVMPN